MQGKKIIILFLGLALPGLVFVFLKMFGKNQFDVPLLHEQGVTDVDTSCLYDYPVPYTVPDSILQKLYAKNKSLIVVNFGGEAGKFRQVKDQFAEKVQFVDHDQVKRIAELPTIKSCFLLLREPNSIVLLDEENRIRGYYDGKDLDELDRLEAEIKILLKQY